MCGIFGAKDFNKFEKLYIKNRDRGSFAHGFMYLKRNGSMYVTKNRGVCSLTGQYAWQHQLQYDLYLGHTQAPTSAERNYSYDYTHPFEYGDFVVAHNGVLENHLDLAIEHRIDPERVKVDSQIFPMLMDDLFVGSDVLAIQEACSMIKGIFSCWIFCKKTKLCYVVRNGSTLYSNENKTAFSSIPVDDINHELDEGVVYCFTTEGLTSVGRFKNDNPFFVL